MKWVNVEDFEGKKYRLDRCIEKLEQRGRRVVLVGVSAGGPMAVIGLAEHGSVAAAVSVSGFLKPSADDRKNPMLQATSWFEAADRAEKVAKRLGAGRLKRLLTVSGTKDNMIDPRRQHVAGSKSTKVRGSRHLPTVIKVLVLYPHTIRRFVRGLDSRGSG